MGRKPSASKINEKLLSETVEPQPFNGNVKSASALDPQFESPRHRLTPLKQEQVNQELVHEKKNVSERNKAKHHGASVRRSERIKSGVVHPPNLKSGVEYVEDVTVSDSEKDEPNTQLEQVLSVLEPEEELEPEPEPELEPVLEPMENLSEKSLEEKVNYILKRIGDLDKIVESLRSKQPQVDENNGMHEAPSMSYRNMYFDSQKKIEALTDENRQLHGKLENALGKIEVYEKQIHLYCEGLDKVKDIAHASAFSNLAKATETAVHASAQACSASKRKRAES